MTKAEECKAKIEALRWVLDLARHHTDDASFDFGYTYCEAVSRDVLQEGVEREIQSLNAQARASQVPA